MTATKTKPIQAPVRQRLVRTGYDPTYGARPLKRAIQRELETPLAKQILSGTVRDGQRIYVDVGADGALRFQPADI